MRILCEKAFFAYLKKLYSSDGWSLMMQNKIIKIYYNRLKLELHIYVKVNILLKYYLSKLFYFLIPSACCFLEDSEMSESLSCTFTRG